MEENFEVHKIVIRNGFRKRFVHRKEVPRERVQQCTAEQIGDVPQFRKETVEKGDAKVNTTLQERISERSEAIKVPKISRQGSVEVVKTTL